MIFGEALHAILMPLKLVFFFIVFYSSSSLKYCSSLSNRFLSARKRMIINLESNLVDHKLSNETRCIPSGEFQDKSKFSQSHGQDNNQFSPNWEIPRQVTIFYTQTVMSVFSKTF